MKYLVRDKNTKRIFTDKGWIDPSQFVITNNAYTSKLNAIRQVRFRYYANTGEWPSKNYMDALECVKVKGVNAYEIME